MRLPQSAGPATRLMVALATACLLTLTGPVTADTKTYSNGARYDGQMSLGKPHGIGTMHLPGGGRYVGEFVRGNIQGWGKIIDEDGKLMYEGQFSNGWRNGTGKAWYLTGDFYEGQFKDDKRHGHGELRYSDGTRYVGQFDQGAVSGRGRMIQTDGRVFDGLWDNSTYIGPAQ